MAYGKLQSERELKTTPNYKAPPLEWPEKGVIEVNNISFKYAVKYPYVLKSISFKIESNEKVSFVLKPNHITNTYWTRLVLWVGLELASLPYCQHCSD